MPHAPSGGPIPPPARRPRACKPAPCERRARPQPSHMVRTAARVLLQLDARSCFLELGLELLGLVLRDALLDGAGGTVDDVLRLLEAETRDRTHDLDHLDLLVA